MMSRRLIVVSFFFSTYKRWWQALDSSSSFDALFINSRRWWQVDIHCRLFSFCLCAPREDDDEWKLVILFLCFVYVHPEKTTTSWHSSLSSFFVLSLCTQRRQWQASAHCHLFFFGLCAPRKDNHELVLIVVFFCFVYVYPKKMTFFLFCFFITNFRKSFDHCVDLKCLLSLELIHSPNVKDFSVPTFGKREVRKHSTWRDFLNVFLLYNSQGFSLES